jgi:hypothetical protein
MLMILLIVLLVVACVGTVPAWPHASGWGYGPSGGLGLVVLVLLLFVVFGHLRF